MGIFKSSLLIVAIATFTSCASGYRTIEPQSINYISISEADSVRIEYKYDLLDKKYAKKELRKGVKLVAVKVTNNSQRDLIFGRDVRLTYENGSEIYMMDNQRVFKKLKQSPASYLFYLLMTPVNLYTTTSTSNGIQETGSTPIGLVLGPGLAGGNMIAASSANKKFKTELLEYDINGSLVEKGKTVYGLIGIETDSFDALKLKIDKKEDAPPAVVLH